MCLRLSTDRDLSIRAIKSYLMRCSSSDTPRRAFLQLHSLLHTFRRSISQSIFNKKISKNIWLKASQQGRSFKPLKSGFGSIGRLYYRAIILLLVLLVIARRLNIEAAHFLRFLRFFFIIGITFSADGILTNCFFCK